MDKERLHEQHGFTYSERPPQRDVTRQRVIRPGYPPASTHRAGFHAGTHPEDAPYLTGEEYEDEEHSYVTARSPTSVRRYDRPALPVRYELHPDQVQHIPPRRTAQQYPPQDTEDELPAARRRRRSPMHWLWYAGIGAVVALSVWIGVAWVSNWWTDTQNDWTYTQAFRTFSVDQAVGHNHDSNAHPSHFIVQNDNRHILIIELPADDATKVMIYSGPLLLGDGQNRTPVTVSFQVNRQTGRVDLILHIQDQSYVFTNNGTKFVAPTVH